MSGKRKSAPGAVKRWNGNSKAARILRAGLKDGSIDPNATPKNVYETNDEFQTYTLDQFRSNFNKLKAELGHHMRGGGKCNPLMADCYIQFTNSVLVYR